MNCETCGTVIPDGAKFCLECGSDLSDPGGGPRTTEHPADLSSQLTVSLEGRYQVKDMLGRGGMGAVFLAQDLTLERPVAIKVLPPEVSHDENLVARFEREARTAAKLDHPNIIPIFSVESQDDLHFFVMKYVAGESLERLTAAGPAPIQRAQEVVWEAARALGHAHQRGVVHRDIKPANIMVDEEGRVLLADFGISKAMQSATQFTSTGQVIGTPYYMSPEQAKGQAVDGRSDQYSLAVVGYQLLTGKLPFTDDAVHTIIYKHIFEAPPRIETARPDAPAFLVNAIHKGMAKEPDDRFATMEEFASAVFPERHVTAPVAVRPPVATASPDAPTTITPTTGPTVVASPPRPRPRKRRGLVTVAAVALLAGGGGGGYWAWQQGLVSFSGGGDAAGDPIARAVPGDSTAVTPPPVPDTSTREVAAEPPPRTLERPPATTTTTPQRTTPVQRKPAAPAAPRMGRLTVAVIGGYATVYIDDARIRDTPLINHELPVGRHILRLSNPRCDEWVDTLRVAANETVQRRVNLSCGGP